MAKKLYIKGVQPVTEVKVESENKLDSVIIGFKRDSVKDSLLKAEQYQKLVDEASSLSLAEQMERQDSIFKESVAYIKDAKVSLADTEQELLIEDTRNVEVFEGLWESPRECLDVLLDTYLDDTLWRPSIFTAYNDLTNGKETTEELEVKN